MQQLKIGIFILACALQIVKLPNCPMWDYIRVIFADSLTFCMVHRHIVWQVNFFFKPTHICRKALRFTAELFWPDS